MSTSVSRGGRWCRWFLDISTLSDIPYISTPAFSHHQSFYYTTLFNQESWLAACQKRNILFDILQLHKWCSTLPNFKEDIENIHHNRCIPSRLMLTVSKLGIISDLPHYYLSKMQHSAQAATHVARRHRIVMCLLKFLQSDARIEEACPKGHMINGQSMICFFPTVPCRNSTEFARAPISSQHTQD
jgi:hypothetical protein